MNTLDINLNKIYIIDMIIHNLCNTNTNNPILMISKYKEIFRNIYWIMI